MKDGLFTIYFNGMLVIWPGWVPHEVLENKSNKQRINIAWGINYN